MEKGLLAKVGLFLYPIYSQEAETRNKPCNMTKLLYYCHVMKKCLVIILVLSFVTSIFDVIDVSDLRVGDREIFSTTDSNADNDDDDISAVVFSYAAVTAFVLPNVSINPDFSLMTAELPQIFSNDNILDDFRPEYDCPPPILA